MSDYCILIRIAAQVGGEHGEADAIYTTKDVVRRDALHVVVSAALCGDRRDDDVVTGVNRHELTIGVARSRPRLVRIEHRTRMSPIGIIFPNGRV